jgi:hypothetical protein
VFADITDETGFAQTVTAQARVPPASPAATNGAPSDPDDSWIGGRPLPPAVNAPAVSDLGDGLTMTWELGKDPVRAGSEMSLAFLVRDPAGAPVALEPYMGMAAHAVVLRDDGSVFVHLHPMGTVSMASLQKFEGQTPEGASPHAMHHEAQDGKVSFPWAFPKPGPYRLWVQVKSKGVVRTGVFDLFVR